MALTNTTLDTAPAALFTSTGTNAVIVMYLCNTGATPAEFSLYAVPLGATANASTVIYSQVSLTGSDTYVLDTERLLLDNGDSIWGSASVTANIVATVNTIAV